jgi:hypothetical protein
MGTFRKLKEFPAYRVSRTGRIQTCWRREYTVGIRGVKYVLSDKWVDLPLRANRYGYVAVDLSNGRYAKIKRLGRLVLEVFVGPCPEGMVCCHNDGNKLNNRLSNLRWDTQKNNEQDKKRHGTYDRRGHPKGKLSGSEARMVVLLCQGGVPPKIVAKELGVWTNLVKRIARGESYKEHTKCLIKN